MNEDDTFLALRKISFRDLKKKRHREYPISVARNIPEEFFKKHGWTREEYLHRLVQLHEIGK